MVALLFERMCLATLPPLCSMSTEVCADQYRLPRRSMRLRELYEHSGLLSSTGKVQRK